MKLAVIGSGYVGLVAGVCFSNTGNDVALVDIDHRKIDMLRRGEIPIYEPGLKELLDTNAASGRLTFTTELDEAVASAEVVILAVGTPPKMNGTVDMRAMEAAARQVGRAIRQYTIVVTKSTVPVGTHRRIGEIIRGETEVEFDYVANPEFLKEGAAVDDFLKPDRVIIGADSERAVRVLRHLYAPFMRRSDRLLVMDPCSAEMTKYACNAMLASRVSFMNEMAQLAEQVGANIDMVRHGMGSDHRIGSEFLYPSLGYGGSCFPKDVKALISMGRQMNCPMRLIEAVDEVNRQQRESMFHRIRHHFDGTVNEKRFAIWGLAFKARTDDVRESPALTLIQRLVGAGATIAAHDPKAIGTAREVLGERNITYCEDMYAALDGAHALVVCTEWPQYRTPDFQRIKQALPDGVVFDGRNLYDLDWMRELGLVYMSVGRPVVCADPQRQDA